MNKKGLVFFYTLMLGITIIVLGIALAYPFKVIIDEKMTEMTCSTPASDWDQALCWILDILKPVITGGFIFIGFAILFAKSYISR